MFPSRSQVLARERQVRQARDRTLEAQQRWHQSLRASATSPRGLAIGFAAGFGIGYLLRGSPTEEVRKLMTLPALITTVRALLLAR